MMPPDAERANYETLRDCLSEPILQALSRASQPSPKRQKRRATRRRKASIQAGRDATAQGTEKQSDTEAAAASADADDLADFVEYLASEIFTSLPPETQTLSHHALQTSPPLQQAYDDPLPSATLEQLQQTIPASVADSLSTYSLLSSTSPTPLAHFLAPVLTAYVAAATAAPPATYASKAAASACELCDRDWVPLTYHHLIPRAVHEKAVKRGWHAEAELNAVAWLCRACHSFVHRIASNEELAQELYSVDRLLEREDVQKWVAWAGKVRWKAR